MKEEYYEKIIFPVKYCHSCQKKIKPYRSIFYAQDKCFCSVTCRHMMFLK